jgi:hypothetical protein
MEGIISIVKTNLKNSLREILFLLGSPPWFIFNNCLLNVYVIPVKAMDAVYVIRELITQM